MLCYGSEISGYFEHKQVIKMSQEQKISIDGKEYALNELSDAAKNQLVSLKAADGEIARLQTQLAIAQTARNAYARALAEQLPKD